MLVLSNSVDSLFAALSAFSLFDTASDALPLATVEIDSLASLAFSDFSVASLFAVLIASDLLPISS